MRKILLALTAAGAIGAAGCGSGGDDGTGTVAGGAPRGDDDAQLAFTRCLRDNGIDVQDARPGSGPQRARRVQIGRGVSPQVMERAVKTCREKTGGGPPELTAEQREEFRDQALKFARCMRENGVDMPDPQVTGSGGVLMRARRGSFNPDSPAFRRAEQACREFRPEMRGGGPR